MSLKYACDGADAGYNMTASPCNDPIYIIYQFFISPNPVRHAEIQHCLRKNAEHPHVHRVILLNERIYTNEELGVSDSDNTSKIIQHNIGTRLRYSDVFRHCRGKYAGYWVIINSDIFFDATLDALRYTDMHKLRKMWALIRWNLPDAYTPGVNETLPTALDMPSGDTQDCWIFHTNHAVDAHALQLMDFGFGVPGCDNKMVYVAQVLGFDVVNAPNLVRSYHYHTSNHRNYTNDNRIPPPYGIVYPTGYDATTYAYFSKVEERGYADHSAFLIYLQNAPRFLVLQPDADITKLCYLVARYEHAKRILDGQIDTTTETVTPEDLRAMATDLFAQNGILKSRGIVLKNTKEMREYGDRYLHAVSRATCILKPSKWSEEYNAGIYIHDAMFKYTANYPVYWNGVLEAYHSMYGRPNTWLDLLSDKRVLVLCDRADECKASFPKSHTLFGRRGVLPDATYIFKTIPEDKETLNTLLTTWVAKTDVALVASETRGNEISVSIYDLGRNAINVGKTLYYYFGLWDETFQMHRPDMYRLAIGSQ